MTIEIPIEVIHAIGNSKLRPRPDNRGVSCEAYVACYDCPFDPSKLESCSDYFLEAVPQLLIHYPELFI